MTRLEFAWLLALLTIGCSSVENNEGPRGRLGETCHARDDCAEEFACIRGVCSLAGIGLTATGKSCYRIECEEDQDCCSTFQAPTFCSNLEELCTDGETFACDEYERSCVCREVCERNICTQRGIFSCETNDDCSESRPYCQEGQCVRCLHDSDCSDGWICSQNACVPRCTHDGNCGYFESCIDGRCEPRGCQTDRECAFLLGDARAACRSGECIAPCSSDLECWADQFEVCHDGRCVFAGCNTDDECRIALEIARTNARAECR